MSNPELMKPSTAEAVTMPGRASRGEPGYPYDG